MDNTLLNGKINSGVSAARVGMNYLLFTNMFMCPLLEKHLCTVPINACYL